MTDEIPRSVEGQGVRLDVERNEVSIAGTVFPACAVICPPWQDDPEVDSRVLFANGMRREEVFEACVPMENGAFVVLTVQTNENPGIWLAIESRYCWLDTHPYSPPGSDDPLWIPITLVPQGRRLVPGISTNMHHCDVEWVAEVIERWSRFEVRDEHEDDAPQVEIITVARGVAMVRGIDGG